MLFWAPNAKGKNGMRCGKYHIEGRDSVVHLAAASRSVDLHILSQGGRGKEMFALRPQRPKGRRLGGALSPSSNHLHLKVPSTKPMVLQGANGRFQGEWTEILASSDEGE